MFISSPSLYREQRDKNQWQYKMLVRIKHSAKKIVTTREGWLTIIVILTAIVALLFNFYCLHRTFIPLDESWYLYLQKNAINDQIWRGHLLFKNWDVLNNIYYNRLVQFAISLTTWSIFAAGLTCWIKKVITPSVNFLLIFGLMFLLYIKLEQTFVCNYMLLVPAFGACSLGCMLFGLTYNRNLFFGIAGVLISLILPQKITALALFPFMVVTVFVSYRQKWNATLWLIGGFILGVIGYCTIIESPQTIYTWLNTGFNELSKGETNHGLNVLLPWIRETIFQYVNWILLALILISIPSLINRTGWFDHHSYWRIGVILFVIAFIIYFFRVNVGPHIGQGKYFFVFQNLVLTLTFVIVLSCWKFLSQQAKIVISLILIAPALLCFGTDTPIYHYSSVLRLTTPLVALVLLLNGRRSFWIILSIFTLCISAIVLTTCPPKPHTNYWGDKLSEQTVNLGTVYPGQNVLLSPEYISLIEFCKKEIPRGSEVLNRTHYWFAVYLQDLHPMCNSYRTQLQSSIDNARKVVNSGRTLYVLTLDPAPSRTDGPISEFVQEMKEAGYSVTLKTHNKHQLFTIHQ